MALQDAVQRAASGDNVVGHVVSAAVFGDSLASCAVWGVQTFAHVDPPAALSQLVTACGVVAASYLLKRLGQ